MTSALDKAFTLIRQLQGALGGDRIVRGNVSSAGALIRGRDFTSSRSGTGLYAIAWDTPFSETPTVTITTGNTATGGGAMPLVETENGFTLATYNTAGTLVDVTFGFIAAGF